MKLNLEAICTKAKSLDKKLSERSQGSKVIGTVSRKNFRRLVFHVKSKGVNSNRKGHIVTILFPYIKLSQLKKNTNLKPNSQRTQLWCTCPAFAMQGPSYNATELNYNLGKNSEERAPDVRDPERKHLICKHILAVYDDIKDDTFIRLYWRFMKSYQRKKKKSEFDQAISSYLYNYLLHNGINPTDSFTLLKSLKTKQDLETFLENNNLIL